MHSLLQDLRSKNRETTDNAAEAFNKALRECPPVSAALLMYLEKMFARKQIKPNDPTMQQELVFQAGIDKVVMHLRSQNDRQENEIREARTK